METTVKQWYKGMEEGCLARSVCLIIFRGKCQERLAQGGDTSEESQKITIGDPSKSSSASGVIITLEKLMKIISL